MQAFITKVSRIEVKNVRDRRFFGGELIALGCRNREETRAVGVMVPIAGLKMLLDIFKVESLDELLGREIQVLLDKSETRSIGLQVNGQKMEWPGGRCTISPA